MRQTPKECEKLNKNILEAINCRLDSKEDQQSRRQKFFFFVKKKKYIRNMKT